MLKAPCSTLADWKCIFKIRIHITDYKFAACLSFRSFVGVSAAAAAVANFRLFYLFFLEIPTTPPTPPVVIHGFFAFLVQYGHF